MTDLLTTALREVGSPTGTAQELAAQARIDWKDGAWMLLLLGHGAGIDAPVTPASWTEAVEHIARNLAADNAEAVERTGRGETGWTPLWPLPDRRPRR